MFLFFTHDQSPVHLDLEMHLIQHFFGNERISIFKKIYKYGIKAPIKSHTCIFFRNDFFFISKKIYKCWIKRISKTFTTTRSSHFLSPNGQYDGQDVKQLMLKMRKYWLEKAQEVICSKFFKILYTF